MMSQRHDKSVKRSALLIVQLCHSVVVLVSVDVMFELRQHLFQLLVAKARHTFEVAQRPIGAAQL